ncbi:hypothetical protein LIER_42760 [Lithospermum erythrorhizon]|uniref:Uncharacterized protein n=1 Tax=Lithospermum erythrorhizon TaxID=34254 RepID=A0AAV3NWI7_LITER
MSDNHETILVPQGFQERSSAVKRPKLSAERANVGIFEFNLKEHDIDSDSNTGDVEKSENMDLANEENEDDHQGSDSEYSVEDVLYGKKQDNFDDGYLGGSEPILI